MFAFAAGLLTFAGRFAFAFAFAGLFTFTFVFPFAFSFLLAGRLGLFAFAFAGAFVLRFALVSSGVGTVSGVSPALVGRLMSIATV